MARKTEITYMAESESSKNSERILEILSNGVYEYLKDNGFLGEDSKIEKRVKSLLDKTKKIVSSGNEKDEKD